MPMSDRAAYNILSHWVETTPHFVFDTMFPVETVRNSQQWLVIHGRKMTSKCRLEKKKRQNVKKKKSHPTRGFLFFYAGSRRNTEKSRSMVNFLSGWHALQIYNHATLNCFTETF